MIDDQIKTWRSVVAEHLADQCVGLATMVGLMIEEMVERRREYLLDVLRIDKGPVSDGF